MPSFQTTPKLSSAAGAIPIALAPLAPRAHRSPPQPVSGDAIGCGERWDIWRAQMSVGHDPCFATPQRFLCEEIGCRWRDPCLRMRAEWLR